MARRKSKAPERGDAPARNLLMLEPPLVQRGHAFLVRGSGWDVLPLAVEIGRSAVRPQRILLGSPVPDGFRPDASGDFLLEMTARDLDPGRHPVRVKSLCGPAIDAQDMPRVPLLKMRSHCRNVPPEDSML